MPGFQLRLVLKLGLVLALLSLLLFVFAVLLARENIPVLENFSVRKQFESDYQLFVYQLFIVTALAFFSAIVTGVIVTHRIAGPLYAIHKYLDKLLDGQMDTEDLKIRKNYELQELAEKINRLKERLKNPIK